MEEKKTLIAFGIYFIGFLLLEKISSLIISHNSSSMMYTVAHLLEYLIILTILIIYFHKDLKIMFNYFKKNYKDYFKKIYYLYPITLVFMLIINSLISLKYSLPSNELAIRALITKYPFYSILTTTLLAPIIEELVFRLSFNEIKSKVFYLILTSLIFAFVHISSMSEMLYLIPYFALGFCLGLTYQKTGNIIPAILTHIFHNLIVLLMIMI